MYSLSSDTANKQAGALGKKAWGDTFPQGCDGLDLLLQAAWNLQRVLMPPTMPCSWRDSVKRVLVSDEVESREENLSSAINHVTATLVEGFKSFSGAPCPFTAIVQAITVTNVFYEA